MNLSTIIEFFIITVILSTPNESLRRKTIRYNNEAGTLKRMKEWVWISCSIVNQLVG